MEPIDAVQPLSVAATKCSAGVLCCFLSPARECGIWVAGVGLVVVLSGVLGFGGWWGW